MAFRRDYNVETEDDKTSRINAAGIINITIENLWRDVYSAMKKGDLVTLNRSLDALWVNLGGDCKKGDVDEIEMKKINASLYKTGSLNHKKVGFANLPSDESEKMALQYLLLCEKSLFLRRLQNKQGKGTAYETGDEYDIE